MAKVGFCVLIVLVTCGFAFNHYYSERTGTDALLVSIDAARKRLNSESVQLIKGEVGTRRVRVGRRSYKEVPVIGIIAREMAIAVSDPSGEIRVARAIKRDPGFEVLSSGFTLSMRRENGINSDIQVIEPPGGRVLAVKYAVSNEGNRFGPGPEVIQAIYTPYSPEIKTEAVVQAGLDVQDDFIDKAYARLRERTVLSRAFPSRTIVDVIPKNILRVLLINEHIDPSEFKSAGVTKPLAERVLTVIGTNRDKAYAYSISPAGARGLVQMIPSTYSLLVEKYPAAGLKSNFLAGMQDPVNAVMAQVLLCDSDWQAIRLRTEIEPDRIGPYLAAAYNGGVGRVISFLNNSESDWMESPDSNSNPTLTVSKRVAVKTKPKNGKPRTKYVVKRYTQPIFRNETSKYVSQYHWINNYLASRRTVKDTQIPKAN